MSTQNPWVEGPGVQQQRPVTSGSQVSVPSLKSHGAPTSCACSVETRVVFGGVAVPLQAARTNTPRHRTIRDLNMIASGCGASPSRNDGAGTAPSRPAAKWLHYISSGVLIAKDRDRKKRKFVGAPSAPFQRRNASLCAASETRSFGATSHRTA